jgi:DNA-binding MarR family transcriptional regulator
VASTTIARTDRLLLLRRLAEIQSPVRARFRATLSDCDTAQFHAATHAVTLGQMEAMMLLHEAAEALTMGELADALGMTPSSASQLVERLVRLGLVERLREEDDRRVVRVVVTTGTKRKFDAMVRVRLRALEHLTAALSDSELRTLVELLQKLGSPVTAQPKTEKEVAS